MCYNKGMEQRKYYLHRIDDLVTVKRICTVHYQSLGKGYVSEEEAHNFWELIYADKGEIAVTSDGEKTLLHPREVFFIPPNAPHFVESGESEPNIFIVSFDCRSESMLFFRNRRIVVPKKRLHLLETMLAEAQGTFVIPDFDPSLTRLTLRPDPLLGGEQMLKNALEALLIHLLREENDQAPETMFVSKIAASDELEDEIMRTLRADLYSKFSLDELCERLHYGKAKLCSFFREKTGGSIYHTYLRLKTDEAKKLIRMGRPFSEIAELLCFDSVSSFNSAFKRLTGMTPGEYRSSIR